MALLDENCLSPLGAGIISPLGAETCRKKSAMILLIRLGTLEQHFYQNEADGIYWQALIDLLPSSVALKIHIMWIAIAGSDPPAYASLAFQNLLPSIVTVGKVINDPIFGDRFPASAILEQVEPFAQAHGGRLDTLQVSFDHGHGFGWNNTTTSYDPTADPVIFDSRVYAAMALIAARYGTEIGYIKEEKWPTWRFSGPNDARLDREKAFGALLMQEVLTYYGVPFEALSRDQELPGFPPGTYEPERVIDGPDTPRT